MTRKSFITILIVCIFSLVQAQDETYNITPRQAYALLKSLPNKAADTIQIDKLLRLALYNILKVGEIKADLDSAVMFVNEAEPIAARINSPAASGYLAWVKSNLYRERGEKDRGKKMGMEAINLLYNTSDKYHLGSAYLEMAHYYDYNDQAQVPEKIRLVEQAATALEHSGFLVLKGYTLEFLADLYSTQAQNMKALHTIKRSLETYQSINYKKLQGAYNICGAIYFDLADYRNALTYQLKAMKVAEDLKDAQVIGGIYNNLGIISDALLESESAQKYYKLAMEDARKRNDLPSITIIFLNLSIDYDVLHRYREELEFINRLPERKTLEKSANWALQLAYLMVYTKLKQYGKAEISSKQLLKEIKTNHLADRHLTKIYPRLVRYYIDSKQFPFARFYLNKLDSLDRAVDNRLKIAQNYQLKFQLDSAQGNYPLAIYNLSRYNILHDSIYNATRSRQLKQIQIIYETEQKENEIKIKDQNIRLLNQKNELQLGTLQQAKTTRNWIIGGTGMILIIAGLLYRQSALRKKNNLLVTHKNDLLQHLLIEKEWLLKEVHHRVKNNLHTVICLLEAQARHLENDALEAIENSQHRIYAMSLIHQKLYQSDDIKTIDMSAYIPELVESLADSFDISSQIKFRLNIQSVNLTLSQAIPLGLILNEAVTNSIKYAFPAARKGEISILMMNDRSLITLQIADDGIGMPKIDHEAEPDSMGLRLMKGLSEDIDAALSFEVDQGTRITIVFKPDKLGDAQEMSGLAAKKEEYI
jgi:two-component sensor histidine kinase/tetratricopeptide (TPR) repeat protein